MNTIIRPAKESDLEQVANYAKNKRELFYVYPTAQFPLTKDQLLTNFTSRVGNTVVDQGGIAVAFANYIAVKSGEYAMIGNVVVSPALRNKGIGESLIEYMVKNADVKYNVQKIIIPCFSSNAAGLRFYKRMGFLIENSELRQDYHGESVQLHFLSKLVVG